MVKSFMERIADVSKVRKLKEKHGYMSNSCSLSSQFGEGNTCKQIIVHRDECCNKTNHFSDPSGHFAWSYWQGFQK